MNGRERVTAMLEGREVDRLPHIPIVMLFAARHAGTTFRDDQEDEVLLKDKAAPARLKFPDPMGGRRMDEPVREQFEFCVEMELRFGRAQAEAGVEQMGVEDAAASLAGPLNYNEPAPAGS